MFVDIFRALGPTNIKLQPFAAPLFITKEYSLKQFAAEAYTEFSKICTEVLERRSIMRSPPDIKLAKCSYRDRRFRGFLELSFKIKGDYIIAQAYNPFMGDEPAIYEMVIKALPELRSQETDRDQRRVVFGSFKDSIESLVDGWCKERCKNRSKALRQLRNAGFTIAESYDQLPRARTMEYNFPLQGIVQHKVVSIFPKALDLLGINPRNNSGRVFVAHVGSKTVAIYSCS